MRMPEPWSSMSYESRPAVRHEPHVGFGTVERVPRSSDSNQSIEVRTISDTTITAPESDTGSVATLTSRLSGTRIGQYNASTSYTNTSPHQWAPPATPPQQILGSNSSQWVPYGTPPTSIYPPQLSPPYAAAYYPACNMACIHGRPSLCPVHAPVVPAPPSSYPPTFPPPR